MGGWSPVKGFRHLWRAKEMWNVAIDSQTQVGRFSIGLNCVGCTCIFAVQCTAGSDHV